MIKYQAFTLIIFKVCLGIFGIPLFTFVGIQFCGGCVDVLVMFLCLVASSYTPVCQAAAQYT